MEENTEAEGSVESESQLLTEKTEEEKEQVNLEVLETVETDSEQPVYQIRPQLHEKYFSFVQFIFCTVNFCLRFIYLQ